MTDKRDLDFSVTFLTQTYQSDEEKVTSSN